eukprot:TRINITY_DN65414_c0_g1_i1.p1 TRINITY_DN65414_c0_g1~~TRINITY_DN65414_c0_g1_i1.p1  ORF type:complete len:832 (-),score=215.59 TRINITY_DN65414_c0_g1_i1:59-2554(-)
MAEREAEDLAGLADGLAGQSWRTRACAAAKLAERAQASSHAGFLAVEAILPKLTHRRWRTRAAAAQALKACAEVSEASFSTTLGVLEGGAASAQAAAKQATARAVDRAVLETSSEDLGREHSQAGSCESIAADVPVPMRVFRSLSSSSEEFKNDIITCRSRISSEDLTEHSWISSDPEQALESQISELRTMLEQQEVKESAAFDAPARSISCSGQELGALLHILLAAARGDGESPGVSLPVAQQLRLCKAARQQLQRGGSEGRATREASVDVLAEFGGSNDVCSVLSDLAGKDASPEVRCAATAAAARIAGRFPGRSNVENVAELLALRLDDMDAAVRCEATRGLADLDIRTLQSPRASLLAPLLRALADKDTATRRAAAVGLLAKADKLRQLPVNVLHGFAQPAGRGLACIRTASDDEVERRLLEQLHSSHDWWALQAAVAMSFTLSGSSKSRAWDAVLARLGLASGAALARGVGNFSEELRSAASIRLGVLHPAWVEKERTEDALRHVESSWWRLRAQAVQVLIEAIEGGSYEAGLGVVKVLPHASSRVRLAAIEILSHLNSRCLPDICLRAVEGLLERIHDPVSEIRLAASEAFGRVAANGGLGGEALQAIFRQLVHGASAEVRRASGQVLVAISEVDGHGPRLAMIVSGFLTRALTACEAKGSDAKHVALSVLAQILPRGHEAAELALCQLAKTDLDPSVRLAALDALKAVAGEGSLHLRNAALQLVLDEDDVVRDAAAELLEHMDFSPKDKESSQDAAEAQELKPEASPEQANSIFGLPEGVERCTGLQWQSMSDALRSRPESQEDASSCSSLPDLEERPLSPEEA